MDLTVKKENGKPKFVNVDGFNFSGETKKLLKEDFALDNFLKKIVHLINLKS